jgi:maleylpyruvate isomerase
VKLHSYWRSSSSWRVRIILGLKGVVHEIVPVNIAPGREEHKSSAYLALHPAGQVPILEIPGADARASMTLSQSVAIVELLEELHPTPALLPKDPLLKAKVREVVEVINSGIQPFQNSSVLHSIERWTDVDVARSWLGTQITAGLQRVQLLLERHCGAYCFGDSLTLADAFLIPQLYGARRFAADLTGLDALLEIEKRCASLPAFQRAHPDAQPDAPPAAPAETAQPRSGS